MVVALIALFVALGGSGYAAVKVNGRNLDNRSVSGKKLKRNSVTGREIKNGSLRAGDFRRDQLRAGPPGRPGPAGPQGVEGDEGDEGGGGGALAWARVSRSGDVQPADSEGFLVENVHPAAVGSGTYCLRGLGFTPDNVTATLGVDGGAIGVAADLRAGFGCPADTQIVVLTFTEAGPRDNDFMLAVN